jgi:hypothetical protein
MIEDYRSFLIIGDETRGQLSIDCVWETGPDGPEVRFMFNDITEAVLLGDGPFLSLIEAEALMRFLRRRTRRERALLVCNKIFGWLWG